MKQMTKLENIIMNRTGCNRETANLIANDILQEVEKDLQVEVARSIFAEIERTLDNYHYSSLLVGEIYPISYYDAELEDAIAELKKKYTEESDG